jgi:hypothetical protein
MDGCVVDEQSVSEYRELPGKVLCSSKKLSSGMESRTGEFSMGMNQDLVFLLSLRKAVDLPIRDGYKLTSHEARSGRRGDRGPVMKGNKTTRVERQ